MRVAWFRAPSATSADVDDATSAVIHMLAKTMTLDIVTESHAHDFVVEQARRPYDVCVYELRNQPGSEFIWAYLFQYPGVLVLQDRSLHDSRVRVLERHRRNADYAVEFQFNHGHPSRAAAGPFPRGTWPMLRAPMLASRLVVVNDECQRRAVEDECPGLNVREVPPSAAGPAAWADQPRVHSDGDALRVAVTGAAHRATVARAVERARDAGADIVLMPDEPSHPVDGRADVVVALESPAEDASLSPALAAMARGKAVIVFEREATAAWPALDPQTWRPRDALSQRTPIVVSIDPRDEAHSLMLALKTLARDTSGRVALGVAARLWWLAHGTPEYAASVWRRVLEESLTLPPPRHHADWPAQVQPDGAEHMRAIAADIGVSITT